MLILTSLLLISGLCVAVGLTVNDNVGETVELPSVLESMKLEEFDFLIWMFNGWIIAEMSSGQLKVNLHAQFKGRLQLSPDFSLTVRELRLEDSGEYRRVGRKKGGSQIPTYKIQLHVYGVCVAVDLTVNGSMGGTVELPSALGSLNVEDCLLLRWIFNGSNIAERVRGKNAAYNHPQFQGRLQLSPDFSLTVRELRLEDSGEYQRVGMKKDGLQIPTYTIQLQVYEPITSVWIQPEYTWDPENHTCAVHLVCNSSGGLRPSYTWRMRDQTESSSRLHFFLSPGEGNVTITCTAVHAASQMSRSHTVKCIPTVGFSLCLLKMAVFSVGLVIMVSAVITVHLRERFYRQREPVQGAETEGTAPPGGRL
ncbi:uncharacterized protein LOC125704837 [Brienomyrus brachyistius]|uniref:uncharacterized protein LOC125704837 n=1 Tax=Brienomyrus brachyistius TaxID=42636 RepID=UPI0020B250D7|nr:uncharacterized protein LOC125704837 [Brienomyrus brachyistius]